MGDVLTSQADRFSKEELNAMLAASPIDEFGNLDYKGLAYVITHGQDDEEWVLKKNSCKNKTYWNV